MRRLTFVLLGLAALLSACVAPLRWPPEGEPGPRTGVEEPTTRPPQGPVGTLVAEASRLERAGSLDGAGAALERALRLAPGDPVLWQRLAALRLRQDRPAEAEPLARKSVLLARGDPTVEARSWLLVAEARRRLGDEAGARIADDKAAKLGP